MSDGTIQHLSFCIDIILCIEQRKLLLLENEKLKSLLETMELRVQESTEKEQCMFITNDVIFILVYNLLTLKTKRYKQQLKVYNNYLNNNDILL